MRDFSTLGADMIVYDKEMAVCLMVVTEMS